MESKDQLQNYNGGDGPFQRMGAYDVTQKTLMTLTVLLSEY